MIHPVAPVPSWWIHSLRSACTVLAFSAAANGPVTPDITTVEGIADHGALAAIQKAYGDWGGAQCGFCTPGFMITVKALLDRNPELTGR